ncbi:hypothetical protein IFM89_010016 [Coptis chinensis]|uniref:Uncharacterized protein n=1 Tax=Coptis chinensis TaxID=261450 RepID=A0A835I120_9MAGN|nr:hypothetical protein IFM89_010016 [Coptis chinensis]
MRNNVQEIESAIVRVTQSLRRSKGELAEVEEKTSLQIPRSYVGDDKGNYFYDGFRWMVKDDNLQVPPAELEHLLQSHPEIADVALILYPDEEVG